MTSRAEDLLNDAANDYVSTQDYDGSYRALALKMVFVAGANTINYINMREAIDALQAGRRWAQQEVIQGDQP